MKNEELKKQFLDALDNFSDAWVKLSESWEQVEMYDEETFQKTWVKEYPFRLSFDEMLFDVLEWRFKLHENLKD